MLFSLFNPRQLCPLRYVPVQLAVPVQCTTSPGGGITGKYRQLYSGHPKVHFGTIVEGSWRGGGGGGVCTVGPPGSLTSGGALLSICDVMLCT